MCVWGARCGTASVTQLRVGERTRGLDRNTKPAPLSPRTSAPRRVQLANTSHITRNLLFHFSFYKGDNTDRTRKIISLSNKLP